MALTHPFDFSYPRAIAIALAVVAGSLAAAPAAAQLNLPWDQTVPLYGQEPPPESHQYDFAAGDWDVVAKRYGPAGRQISELHAVIHAYWVNDGRMMVSEWTGYSLATGERATHGITLRTYSAQSGKWQIVFLKSMWPTVSNGWETEQVGDEMRGGGPTFEERFFDITPDSYEWEQRVTLDGGQTWYLERSQSATRRSGS